MLDFSLHAPPTWPLNRVKGQIYMSELKEEMGPADAFDLEKVKHVFPPMSGVGISCLIPPTTTVPQDTLA